MILGDASTEKTAAAGAHGGATLDALLAGLAQRRPDALALADPPNRSAFTDGAPRRLSFAEADRMVSAIASRLHRMDLPADTVIGIQLPNIVENVLAILGVLRAGMIAAPLPLLWRRAEAAEALARVGAKALITCGRAGGFGPAQLAMAIAAEVFSIRYLCGFGTNLPDGVVAFDDLFSASAPDLPPRRERNGSGSAAAHVATVTFDMGPFGIIPVARSHAELCAGADAVSLEARLSGDGNVVSILAPASFAGICLTLVLWLRSGGTLSLHHPFDRRTLAGQLRAAAPCDALILPGPVAFELAAAGEFNCHAPACVLAPWRASAQLAGSDTWRAPHVALIDIAAFGEVGMVAARRSGIGRPSRLPYGPVTAPHDGAAIVGEIGQSRRGTLTFRGSMAPHGRFPPSADHLAAATLDIGADGAVDTGYECQVDPDRNTVEITGLAPGLVEVGGCRLALHGLQETIRRLDGGATLAAVPDRVLGQRLIGETAAPQALRAALEAAGINPLALAAFGRHGEADIRKNA